MRAPPHKWTCTGMHLAARHCKCAASCSARCSPAAWSSMQSTLNGTYPGRSQSVFGATVAATPPCSRRLLGVWYSVCVWGYVSFALVSALSRSSLKLWFKLHARYMPTHVGLTRPTTRGCPMLCYLPTCPLSYLLAVTLPPLQTTSRRACLLTGLAAAIGLN